ncbi:MAG: hypothetical protein V3T23_13335 [Nitrososphaerales archaeon]
MTWAAVAVAAQERAARAGISEQERARLSFEQRTEPFAQLGRSAIDPLSQLLGIAPPAAVAFTGDTRLSELDSLLSAPLPPERIGTGGGRAGQVNPEFTSAVAGRAGLEGERTDLLAQKEESEAAQAAAPPPGSQAGPLTQLEEINPLVSFLRDEGFESIQESAAARGRLGAGGTLKDLTRFNTQLSSTIVPQLQQQRFNQLFNLVGAGQNAATGQGTAALQTAGNISNLQGNIGQAQAQGAQRQGQIGTDLVSNLSGIFGAQQGGAFGTAPPPAVTNFSQPSTGGAITDPNRFQAFS